MKLDLQQWQQKLEALNPSRIELGLDRVKSVYDRLALQFDGKIVLVAGTNGKGSTVAVLEALLLDQGCSVAAYTSPHLQRFNERARFMGDAAPDEALVEAFNRVEAARGDTTLTYFEFTTLAVMCWFAEKQPQYLVFEVGLGGRLDAVNILDADIAIVTGVALDHTDWLGTDEEAIGREKAGIYRSGKPAIFAGLDIPNSVREHIEEIGAKPFLRAEQIECLELAPGNLYQIANSEGEERWLNIPGTGLPKDSILAALTAFYLLGFELNQAVADVVQRVRLPGRYQYARLGSLPLVLDVAHNPQAAEYLAARLAQEGAPKDLAAITGVMADKPLADIFRPLCPLIKHWYLVRPNLPRAATFEQMCETLEQLGVARDCIIDVGSVENLDAHFETITAAVVFGSFYTVGEFLNYFGERLG